MIASLRRRWRDRTEAWMLARQGRDGVRVEITRGRIYILPSRFGIAYAVLLFGLLLGAMNYTNSMAFMLTFLLGAIYLLAMHHAHRNLLGLVIEHGRVESPFAGQQAVFSLRVLNPTLQSRWAIGADSDGQATHYLDIPALETANIPLPVPAPNRGVLSLPRARVFTRHPFGLFHAWVVLHMEMRVLVYPRPAEEAPSPSVTGGDGRGKLEASGQDDFAGLKEYHPGESPRHIAWKAYARGQPLLLKQFSGAMQATRWFDFASLEGLDTERRLSVMCRWVIDAERDGLHYGLRLPGRAIPPGTGDPHRRACLEALALHGTGR